MKQTLLLMVLAFGMFSINVCAQTKTYKVEDDGFEWYELYVNSRYGAQDKYGNRIIPAEFSSIIYTNGFFKVARDGFVDSSSLLDIQGNLIVPEGCYYPIYVFGEGKTKYIQVSDRNNHEGVYNTYGKCIIPVNRKYVRVTQFGYQDEKSVYYKCQHSGGYYEYGKFSICDASGKVVLTTSKEYRSICLMRDKVSGKYALAVLTDHWYFVNTNENLLWNPQCYTINGQEFKIQKSKDGPYRNLTVQEKNRILFKAELLKGNIDYFANIEKTSPQQTQATTQKETTPQKQDEEKKNPRDPVPVPVPVQEWQACFGCGGLGTMGCDNCGGSGTKYIGDRLHRCSRCNGGGIIPCNVCYGSKGKYVTVYR